MGAAKKQSDRAGVSKGPQKQYYLGDVSRYLGRPSRNGEPMSQEEAVKALLLLGQTALSNRDYESAVEAYASILKLEPNVTAFYNLGSLYARGFGVKRDYVEAARLLHQAELLGNDRAGKLCGRCMFDYIYEGLEAKTAADVYASMAVFVSRVYLEAANQKAEVCNGLLAIAGTLLSRGELAQGTKVFSAAAEFGDDERAQRYLAMLSGSDGDAGDAD